MNKIEIGDIVEIDFGHGYAAALYRILTKDERERHIIYSVKSLESDRIEEAYNYSIRPATPIKVAQWKKACAEKNIDISHSM